MHGCATSPFTVAGPSPAQIVCSPRWFRFGSTSLVAHKHAWKLGVCQFEIQRGKLIEIVVWNLSITVIALRIIF